MKKNKETFEEYNFDDIVCYGYKIQFHIGESVYLKMDKKERKYLVTGIILRPNSSVIYILKQNTTETLHYDFEIINEKDKLDIIDTIK